MSRAMRRFSSELSPSGPSEPGTHATPWDFMTWIAETLSPRIRSAISPRLAMTIFSIMSGLFEDEQRLAEFDRVAALRHDRGDAPGPVGFDLVHHLHRLDDAQHLPDLDLIADLDEGLGSRGGRGVEGPHHRGGDHMLVRLRGRAPGRRERRRRRGRTPGAAGSGGRRPGAHHVRELR